MDFFDVVRHLLRNVGGKDDNLPLAIEAAACGESGAALVEAHIKHAPAHLGELAKQVGIIANHAFGLAENAEELRGSVCAAHENVLVARVSVNGRNASLERLGRDRGDVVNETRISKNRELRGHVAPDGDDVFPPNIEGGAEHPVGVGALVKNLFAGLGVDGAHGVVAATKGDGRAIG